MKRAIVGFSQDDQGDWVAQLACGHTQHVRHAPPWQSRPWVQTEQGRNEYLGTELLCVDCGMPALPAHVARYKETPEFDEQTVPAGLLHRHTLKPGVWGRIVVSEGWLLYVIEREPSETFVLRAVVPGIVEPEVPHHVEPQGKVRFRVEFYR
jgi:tellurite resistance-related uncharacterized protein